MPYIQTQDAYFALQEGESLLEALERTGHQVDYQCRQGYCGACRTKLLAGRVSYQETPLAFIGPDEILPCCCQIDGDIHIDSQRAPASPPHLEDEDELILGH